MFLPAIQPVTANEPTPQPQTWISVCLDGQHKMKAGNSSTCWFTRAQGANGRVAVGILTLLRYVLYEFIYESHFELWSRVTCTTLLTNGKVGNLQLTEISVKNSLSATED